MFKPHNFLRNPEPGAGGGGDPAAPAGGTPAAGGGTVLGTEPSWETTVPAKFREGGKPDGKIQHDAIFKGYAELESAMGKVGKPPAKADDYKFELKDDALLAPEALTELRTRAHKAGYTQQQFEILAANSLELLDAASKELAGDLLGTEADCLAALEKQWPDAKERTAHQKAALRAFNAYFGGDKELLGRIGNMPKVLIGLAKLGAEIKEDAPAGSAETTAESAESLDKEIAKEMNDPAYTNQLHKDHAAQKEKVAKLFERRYGTAPATGVRAASFG